MDKILLAAEAKDLLEREFARLKPVACKSCRPPTPLWGPGVVTGTGYWYLKMLPACPHHCVRVITKIWVDITTQYRIERSEQEIRKPREVRERGI